MTWTRPSRAQWTVFVRLYVQLTVLFAAIYGSTNWIASRSDRAVSLHLDWELAIPLVPWMILIYFSIAVLFWLPLFVCSVDGLRALARRMAFATLAAGLLFVALPVRSGFARTPPDGLFHSAFAVLWEIDAPFNCVPSLHVAYATLVFCALWGQITATRLRLIGGVWYLAICASVLFVHQHHLVDIGGGLLLAWLVGVVDRRRWHATRGSVGH